MVNDLRNQQQSKRRIRGLLSCTECHRRKQKCDRRQPCNDCTQRGLPQRCKYLKPTEPGPDSKQSGSEKATKSRLRRIMTGDEVLLSSESIDSLASSDIGSPILSVGLDDSVGLHPPTYPRITTGIMSPRASGSFPIALPIRPKSPTVASRLNAGIQFRFLGGFDPFSSLPDCGDEPIPKQLLLHYFLARLAPWLSYLDDELTETSPRISWLPFALNHAALFHATLLAAVVHLNRRRPLKDPSALIWFKVQTMKLANENMNDPVQACTDEMLVVALVLLYFNVRGNNSEEYEIHLRGIHEMLKLRGGKENLGMRGMARNWLDICHGPWSDGWEYGHYL